MQIAKSIPKLSISKFTGFITSNEVIVILASTLFTPIALALGTKYLKNVPFIKDHFTILLVVLAFLVFTLSSMLPAGILRAIAIGIAGGLIIGAVVPIIQPFVDRLGV